MDTTNDEEKNKAIEKELLERFKSLLISKFEYKEADIVLAAKNASKKMDCTIIDKDNEKIIGIEAKCLSDSRSDSTAFLSIFGKILKGRKLTAEMVNIYKTFKCEYGFLFRGEDKKKFTDNYSKTIDKQDWDDFCTKFNVTKIYFCGEDDIEIIEAQDVNKAE